jgi:plastocyanin
MRVRKIVSVGLAGLALVALAACRADEPVAPAGRELDSSPLLGATTGSQNYLHTFADPGIYSYHCQYHTSQSHREPGMVIVNDDGADSAFIQIHEGAYHPGSVLVKPHATVRWQNFDDGVHHTVTSD